MEQVQNEPQFYGWPDDENGCSSKTVLTSVKSQADSSLIKVDKQTVIRFFLPSVLNSRRDQLIGSGGLLDCLLRRKEMQDIGKALIPGTQ